MLLLETKTNKKTILGSANSGESFPLVGDHVAMNGVEYVVQQRVFDYSAGQASVTLKAAKVIGVLPIQA